MFIERFMKKISKIKIESFSKELLRIIDSYSRLSDAKIKIKGNKLLISYHYQILIEISVKKDLVTYEKYEYGEYEYKKYFKHISGYCVQSINKSQVIFGVGDGVSRDSKYDEIFRVYDDNGCEQFRRRTKKMENYYEDKQTGEIMINKPSVFENYVENYYVWRTNDFDSNGNYIITRKIKCYTYPQYALGLSDQSMRNTDVCSIRYETLDDDVKEIPFGGHYYGFDKDIFFKYFQKNATMDDIYENVKSKKYKAPNDIFL